jgi:uncharacterized protein (TIGR02452 family)
LPKASAGRQPILGAWGCGVSGHEPGQVAADLRDLLTANGRFAGAFETVVFAVPERRADAPAFEAFRRCFGDASPGGRSS